MSNAQHCFTAGLLFSLSVAASDSAVAAVKKNPLPAPRPKMVEMMSVAAQERGCYRIAQPNGNAVMDFNIGSILLNACSGDTWLLMQDANSPVLRWHLMKKVTDEPVSPSLSPPLSRN